MELRGIDVSAYNTVTDYQEVAADGIEIAIMRITERGNKVDPTFYRNYTGFTDAGLKTGCISTAMLLPPDRQKRKREV